MININELTKKDIGKWVEYNDRFKAEKGKLKSWNDKFIFVVYHCDNKWNEFKNYTAAGAKPENLNFIK